MRRFFSFFLSLAMVLAMVGCSSSVEEQTEQVEQAVTNYFNDIQEGSFEDALQYTDAEVVDELEYGKLNDSIDESIHALGLDEKTEAQLIESVHSAIGGVIDSYTIDNVAIEGNTATVDVTVTGIDPDEIDDLLSKLATNFVSTIGEYLTNNYDQFFGMLTGENDKTMDDMVKDFNEELQTTFKDTTRKTYKLQAELKQDGDQWKIVSLKKAVEE